MSIEHIVIGLFCHRIANKVKDHIVKDKRFQLNYIRVYRNRMANGKFISYIRIYI